MFRVFSLRSPDNNLTTLKEGDKKQNYIIFVHMKVYSSLHVLTITKLLFPQKY